MFRRFLSAYCLRPALFLRQAYAACRGSAGIMTALLPCRRENDVPDFYQGGKRLRNRRRLPLGGTASSVVFCKDARCFAVACFFSEAGVVVTDVRSRSLTSDRCISLFGWAFSAASLSVRYRGYIFAVAVIVVFLRRADMTVV